ncbi:maleylacetoacetate isomerase, partial [Aphelenchoides avenae]
SVAIIEYLEEKFPDARPLLPGNAEQRVLIRSLALQIVCNIQPLQNTGVLNVIDADATSEKRLSWARHWIERSFDALEKQLAGTSGKYCVGDAVMMADACLVPQVQNARRYGVDLSKWPTILRIDSALSELPEFRKAHANNQPDTPESERRSF